MMLMMMMMLQQALLQTNRVLHFIFVCVEDARLLPTYRNFSVQVDARGQLWTLVLFLPLRGARD